MVSTSRCRVASHDCARFQSVVRVAVDDSRQPATTSARQPGRRCWCCCYCCVDADCYRCWFYTYSGCAQQTQCAMELMATYERATAARCSGGEARRNSGEPKRSRVLPRKQRVQTAPASRTLQPPTSKRAPDPSLLADRRLVSR